MSILLEQEVEGGRNTGIDYPEIVYEALQYCPTNFENCRAYKFENAMEVLTEYIGKILKNITEKIFGGKNQK